MMKKIFSILAMAAVCSVGFAQNSVIYKAQTLTQEGKHDEAITALEASLKNPKTTKFAEIYYMLGEGYAQKFNPELIKAANGQPFDTTAFVTNLDKMVNCYTKSNEADHTPDKKGKVKPKFVEKNHSRMLSMLDYYNYAAVFMNQNHKTKESLEYFQKYYDMPKNRIFSEHERDSIYNSKKQAYGQTIVNLALLNFQQKDWDKAIYCADEALKDTISTRDLFIIKMQSYAEKKDSASWLNTLKDAATRTEDPGFMQNLLYYYVSHNDLAGAQAMAAHLVETAPNSKAAWYMKGCVDLNMTKNYGEAIKSFEKSLAIDPNFVEANTNIAYSYINQVVAKKLSGELKYVGKGTKTFKDPKKAAAYRKALNAEMAMVKGYYEKALAYMLKVRELTPDQPKNWAYTLQMIYENLNDKAKKAEIDAIIKTIE